MSSDEQSNKTEPAVQEHTHSPPVAFAPQLLTGPTHVASQLGSYPPHFFAYAPPSDGNHTENGPNGVPTAAPPYMIPFPPPGMVYAFPPQGQVSPGVPASAPPALTKPKRKQVKMACTNCAAACKRCDEDRPCARCQRYGISESCQDGQRKQRKKGVKRGSYKRRNKNAETEWTPTPQAPVAPYTSPEGYYGIYFPNTGAFLPHPPHEVPGQEGSVPANGAPPIMPYYLPAFPPYSAPYGHPAMYPGLIPPAQHAQHAPQPVQPQVVEPQQTIQQVSNNLESPTTPERHTTGKGKDEGSSTNGGPGKGVASRPGTITTATPKKRNRGSKGGDSKTKKVKKRRAVTDEEDKDHRTAQAVAA